MFFFCGTTKMEFFVKTVKIAEIRLLFWQKTIVDFECILKMPLINFYRNLQKLPP